MTKQTYEKIEPSYNDVIKNNIYLTKKFVNDIICDDVINSKP